ncbi:RDD family protein [Streptomyces sp. NPDC002476]|uniref:RDD family protein n=1 Tax=Streptomyces sp. NPDC002476 TaxID=3364648 RepID=UPI00368F0989
MSQLVTGDAVVLGLQPARLPSRALALAIDLVVVGTAFFMVSIGLAMATAALDEAAFAAISVAAFLLVLIGGPIAVETLSRGRSLGKLACGLRVVRDDGGPIRFRHALMRGGMGFVEILLTFGVVACIASLVSERGRRLGDVFAGTLVVRERVPAGRGTAVPPPPPWLVGRFSALDLSAVPDGLWLAIRQYLTRMHQLDAQIGQSMAERLAAELSTRTGVPVPTGVPAGAYLAAVVNERQSRDARRVMTAAAQGGAVPRTAWDGPAASDGPTAPGATSAVVGSAGHAGRADGYAGQVGCTGSAGSMSAAVPQAPTAPMSPAGESPAGGAKAGAPAAPVVEKGGPGSAPTGFAPPA